jgi:hypothetical protein
MNGLSSYERALLERLVPERERQRRTRDESRPKLPFYDNAIPAAEQPDPNLENSPAIVEVDPVTTARIVAGSGQRAAGPPLTHPHSSVDRVPSLSAF